MLLWDWVEKKYIVLLRLKDRLFGFFEYLFDELRVGYGSRGNIVIVEDYRYLEILLMIV